MDKLTNKKVLIADDDTDILSQLTLQLNQMGFVVYSAETQKDAEKLMREVKPDLAIFDLMMENKDSGFILSYKIKRLYPDVPVIIATAVASDTGMIFGIDTTEEKQWIKADLYLEKGLRPEQLQLEIKRLLNIN